MSDPATIEGSADELPVSDEDVKIGGGTDLEPGTALVPVVEGNAGQVIRAEDPAEILSKAQQIAAPLAGLIEQAGLAKNLGGNRKHVEVGGWQAAGMMLGALGGQALHAETVWTRIVRDPANGEAIRRQYTVTTRRGDTYEVDGYDWEARVEVRTAGGVIVGRAEAMCSRGESTWAKRDDYAVRSMAETRAESRAYRRAIGWIMHMAGYNPTPAEEMGHTPGADGPQAGPPHGPQVGQELGVQASTALLALVGDQEKAVEAWGAIKSALFGYMPEAAATALVRAAEARGDA